MALLRKETCNSLACAVCAVECSAMVAYHRTYIYTQYIYIQYIYTQYVYTQYIYTQYIYTQYMYTQYIYTQYMYTQYIRMQHTSCIHIHTIYIHTYTHNIYTYIYTHTHSMYTYYINKCYGMAMRSRLLKIIGLFCRTQSLLQGSFAKETYNFKEPTNRSHPIRITILVVIVVIVAAIERSPYTAYRVAIISRLLKLMSFFCKRTPIKETIFCKRDL